MDRLLKNIYRLAVYLMVSSLAGERGLSLRRCDGNVLHVYLINDGLL